MTSPDNDYVDAQFGTTRLTKREFFAAHAMQGFLASLDEEEAGRNGDASNVARAAVLYADALILELSKPLTPTP